MMEKWQFEIDGTTSIVAKKTIVRGDTFLEDEISYIVYGFFYHKTTSDILGIIIFSPEKNEIYGWTQEEFKKFTEEAEYIGETEIVEEHDIK